MLTTTTRQHGTNCHTATTADDFAEACQHVLTHGYAKVNHVTIDATTAGMVVNVWSKLTEKNRLLTRGLWDKFYAMPGHGPKAAVGRVVTLFWKCCA